MEPSWFFGRIRQRLTFTVKKQGIQLDKKLVFQKRERAMPSVAQWRRLPQLLSRKERRIIGTLVALLVVSGAVVFFGLTGGQFAFAPGLGGRWVEGEVGAPRLANPILATRDTDRDVVSLVYSGLMREALDGTFVPDIADHVVVSPDATRYTVTLRRNVFFHDGEPMSSADVLFTYRAIADQAWHSPYWKSLKDIQVSASDDHTVVFALGKPFPMFESLLTIGILPEHLWKDVAPEQAPYAIWNTKPMGTGPFAFVSLERERTGAIIGMDLTRNQAFYDRRPFLDDITLQFFTDLPSAIAALGDGRIEGTFVPARHTDTEFPEKRFRVTTFDTPQVVTMYFNAKNQELTDGVRTAISKAIDRVGILTRLKGGALEVFGPVPVSLDGPAGPAYTYDLDAAKAVMSKLKKPLTLDVLSPADPFYHDIADVVKKTLTDAGITANVRELDGQEFVQAARTRSYDVLIWSSLMPYGVDLYPYWHSSQIEDPGLNFAGYRNRKADTILEKLRGAVDETERITSYADLTTMLRNDLPAIFLVSPKPQYVTVRRLHGAMPKVASFAASRFSNVRDWYVKQQVAW